MPRNAVVFRPVAARGGWVEVNPAFAERFADLGIDSAAGFLELPGEVVSGHPDRHVMRVVLPGGVFYLKRQHAVTWRERLRNRLAGFGWSSRCDREAAIIRELQAIGLPAPQWVAVGEDGRGRAFLLVQEVEGSADLRRVLSDNELSPARRRELADRLGTLIARVHGAGLTTPDLTAKHLLISADGRDVTPIDWQSACRVRTVPAAERVRSLAALHASVADELASPRERLRVLRVALGGRVAKFARQVDRAAAKARGRRSIRDQRQVAAPAQRLVWVADEAVCAVPDVAAIWPRPAVAAPFYDCEADTLPVQLPDGRDAVLIRGRSCAPLARLTARLRGRPWRSPGVTLGRVLFHLERYGIAAPRLLAFGQRFTGAAAAEWFALHEPQAEALPATLGPATAEQLGRLLRALHDASCRPVSEPLAPFGENDRGVCVRDVSRVRLVRRVTASERKRDLAALAAALAPASRVGTRAGYELGWCSPDHHSRTVGVEASDRPHSPAAG